MMRPTPPAAGKQDYAWSDGGEEENVKGKVKE